MSDDKCKMDAHFSDTDYSFLNTSNRIFKLLMASLLMCVGVILEAYAPITPSWCLLIKQLVGEENWGNLQSGAREDDS